MTLDTLFHLLQAARQQCGHSEYVVIGSLSVLGMSQVTELPKGMTMSKAGLISKPMLLLRLPGTDFLDAQEASNTKERIHQL